MAVRTVGRKVVEWDASSVALTVEMMEGKSGNASVERL